MAAMPMPISNADPRRMYSWWWDSHISPKNSKWLHENLTDMDSKVKQMIKLIEEDADSFARRAEMFYKKRPELMKMVEDFYRAYRALAARYDHANGVLRQAHRTMSEAFPNQVPLLGDDSPSGSAADSGPCTPEMASMRAFLDPDELHKDAMGLSSPIFRTVKRIGSFPEDPDLVTSRKGLKELNDLLGSGGAGKVTKFTEGRARKGLHFFDLGEKERSAQNNGSNDLKARTLSESDKASKTETEILALKNALAKLEAEKEVGLLQYQQSLDRLSKMESEVSRAQEDLRGLNERASKAESEAQTLKELLAKAEAEREVSLLQYEQYLEKVSNLEDVVLRAKKDAGELGERASKAETEAQSLKRYLAVVEAEKDDALVQYKQCLQATVNLEEKLQHAEEDARRINEQAVKAESEVETLKQALSTLTEEKETAALQYQQCLELIASLEHKLARAQEENQRLSCELDNGVAKLKGAEEKCILLERSNQTLHSELESVVQMMGTQSHELTEKQKELGRLWACIQEERLQFMESETAFQTLHHLHSQSQEELRNLASELQQRAQVLKDMEALSRGLQDEIKKVKEENEGLSQLNASSALSITTLEGEILVLRETVQKLEAEVELQVNQRNALQQEIYCLREELNHLNKNHQAVLQQVDSVGLDHERFGSSVKKLQDENSELKEICVRNSNEKTILREKLEQMEKLLEKNAILENSIMELNVELEGVKGKVRASEESYECLLGEKSSLAAEKTTLISQLQITTQNMEKVSEEKKMLENSLLDAKAELEGLRVKSKSLEDSCLLLSDEKSCLIVEKEHLVSQLDTTQQKLENLEKSHAELNEKYIDLEKERVTILFRLEELQISLDAERQEHASFAQLSETQMAGMTSQIHLLQEEGWRWKKEFGEQLDSAVGAQLEIFILQKCVQDLEENNFSLLNECKKLLEASKSSEKRISILEHENQEQQLEGMSLAGQIQILRMGLYQVSKTLDINVDLGREDKNGQNITFLNNVLSKTCDENQQLVLEKSVLVTLLGQLRLEAETVASDKNFLNQELTIKSEKLLLLQGETQKLSNMTEDLRFQVTDGQLRKEELIFELESLLEKQCSLDKAYHNLQAEYSSLVKEISMLEEQKCDLEEENLAIINENISQNTLSLILKSVASEKSLELKELSKTLKGLEIANIVIEEKVKEKERELEAVQTENLALKEALEKSEVDLRLATSVSDQKESELQEMEQKLNVALKQKTELFTVVEDLELVKENQEKQILELSEDNSLQTEKIEFISEANQTLEAKLCATNLQHEETKIREKSLSDEVKLWEMEAAAIFSEQQTCNVREVMFEQKIHELAEVCEIIEDRSNAKDMEIEVLKERVCALEDNNDGLNDQLVAYISAVTSLASCVTSLENHTIFHAELQKSDDGDTKDLHKNGYPISTPRDGISSLKDLEARVKGIDKAVVETEKLATLEHLDTITKLEAAMRQIEELKSRRPSKRENVKTRKNILVKPENELEEGHRHLQNPSPEISEAGNQVLPKDIMLDQISECSSYGISSKRENAGTDHMLELWETESIVSTHNEDHESRKGHRTLNPSIDSLVEKELGVDKLEVSKNISTEANKRKVLERLDSDAQKLTNLQITVQDLKSKAETTENSKKGKNIEYDSVKEQLQETEEAIVKLFELNSMLTKYIHDGSFSSERKLKSGAEPDESGSARRRRIIEQARKGSERLGRLQLEVQKIQFLLLKLDDKKEKKSKTRIREPNPNVMLRDYLYGGGRTRTDQTKKKGNFCSCVRPPTRGD